MSISSNRTVDPGTDHELNLVEQICHRFLESWRQGAPLEIERLLSEVSASDQERLLRGLLIIELRRRRNVGDDPQIAEYVARFPNERALIEQVFEMVPPARRGTKRRPVAAPPASPAARSQPAEEKSPNRAGAADRMRRAAPLPPLENPASRKPAAATPLNRFAKPAKKTRASGPDRHAAPRAEAPEVDEYASLLDDRLLADVENEPLAPPPVLRKKKVKEPPPAKAAKKKRRSTESQPLYEFLGPLVLALVSLLIDVVVAFTNVPAEMPVSWYVAYNLGFVVISLVVTTLALFAAAALLDTSYGFLNTALIKIAAIVLTQAWLSDLLELIPVPFLGGIIAWLATFYMFVTFFDIDHLEAIRSMIIVRVAHTLAFWLLFGAFLSWAFTHGGGDAGGGILPPGNAADLLDDDDDRMFPIAQNDPAAARCRALTQQFGGALVAQDYSQAYQLMSPGYQAVTSAEDFAALHRKALTAYGKPLKCEAGIGTLDQSSLRGPGFERFRGVPPDIRRAWTHAELVVELDDGEMVRCFDCWLLLVESGDGFRIAEFEYAWCD